jgi:hypothetical protein
MYPHRIRLRGPWTCEPLLRLGAGSAGIGDLPPPQRMIMPARWEIGDLRDFAGVVRFIRPFGYPGRIDDFERVWLTFTGMDSTATAWLNGDLLGKWAGTMEFDATRLLRSHNQLVMEIEVPPPCGSLWEEVALEVRATAFLRDVIFRIDGQQLTAQGVVAGSAERPLDLYLFAAGQFLAYETTMAGRTFEIGGELTVTAIENRLPVRVELVDAASIWYVVEGSVHAAQSKQAGESS